MNYIERIIKFTIKHYILAVPVLALFAIPALVGGGGGIDYYRLAKYLVPGMGYSTYYGIGDYGDIISFVIKSMALVSGVAVLSLGLKFIAYPSTYGMLNKALNTGSADLNDFVPALRDNISKYVFYWIGTIVLSIALGVAAAVFVAILIVITSVIGVVAIILWLLFGLVAFIIAVAVSVFTGIWFTAMIVDNLDVTNAAKKSIEVIKSDFLILFGITLLIMLASGIVGAVLGLIFSFIPIIGPVILSLIPAASSFVSIVFYMMVYREKTGRIVMGA